MTEHSLIRQQRQALRNFRQAAARRVEAEKEAETQRANALADLEEERKREQACLHEEVRIIDITMERPDRGYWTPRLVFSPDGMILAACAGSQFALCDVASGEPISRSVAHSKGPQLNDVSFSPDSRLLALAYEDGTVRLLDRATLQITHTLVTSGSRATAIAFSPDGRTLVICTDDSSEGTSLEFWQVKGWRGVRRERSVKAIERRVERRGIGEFSDEQVVTEPLYSSYESVEYIYSGGSLLLLLGTAHGAVHLRDAKSGESLTGGYISSYSVPRSGDPIRIPEFYDWRVLGVAPTASTVAQLFALGESIARSGDPGNRVEVYDLNTRKRIYSLAGHTREVTKVAFSRSGRFLASEDFLGTVILWDLAKRSQVSLCKAAPLTKQEVGEINAAGDTSTVSWNIHFRHYYHSLAFSPDGQLLALGDGFGFVRLWRFLREVAQQQKNERLSHRIAQATAEVERVYQETRRRAELLVPAPAIPESDLPNAKPWNHESWSSWQPSDTLTEPPIVRFGSLTMTIGNDSLKWPMFIPLTGERGLLLKAKDSTAYTAKTYAARAFQSLLLAALASIPPGQLRFAFIDPIGLGSNVAPFMHLADFDESLVTSRAWTEPQHIEQRLADLTEHIENVIQKYLRNEYGDIEEYNAHAGEIAEPYRVLAVFDFPVNFTEAAARRLVSIAQNGPRCGVYTFILADMDKPLPHGFNMTDLERASIVISHNGKPYIWEDDDFKDCALNLYMPPTSDVFDRIIKAVGERAKEASKVEVPFERIAPASSKWWQASSKDGISLPVGPSGARKIQHIELGKGTAQHALVAGKTGSGKSTLLHTIIVSLALTYSPEEVELYLIDFKKGVEFKTYANYKLPHARVIAIESEREFGLSVLQGLDAELKRRGDLFRANSVDSIADYRTKASQKMPRILLLMDEFQEFFTEDDTTASQASQILDRLVRQGRAFGIHVLLGSQTLAGAYNLTRSTIDQMAVRVALQSSEADSRLILSDDNPAARLLSRPGEAIYNSSNGTVEGNNPFQVAWLPDDQRDHYLEQIQVLAQKHEYRPAQPQIVFEGNAPAEVEKNRPLLDLVIAAQPPPPQRALRAWLGDPIALREPVAANFRRQSGSNLLIVGQNDEQTLGMMAVSLLSLAAQLPTANGNDSLQAMGHFYVLDFGAVDSPHVEYFERLTSHVPYPVKIGRRRHLPDMINDVAVEVQRRLVAEDEPAARANKGADQVFLLAYGLQRARDLKQDDNFNFNSFSSEPAPPNPAQQFTNILKDGPDVGVHTLVWCDTMSNLSRGLDRRAMREFAMRVGFQMSAEDSSNLLDTPLASKLGPYRAFFYSEDEGRLEKFRPYALPSEQWLQWVGEQLRLRKEVPLS